MVLNSLQSIREALVEKQNEYAGRPKNHSRVYTQTINSDSSKGDQRLSQKDISCRFQFLNNTVSFCIPVDIVSEGGKSMIFADFTEIWKIQRKIAFSAFKLVWLSTHKSIYIFNFFLKTSF